MANTFASLRPKVLALCVSKEGLLGLHAVLKGDVTEVQSAELEVIYARQLRQWGQVEVPPPAYTEAYRLAKDRNIKVLPIDLSEMEYTQEYTKRVKYLDLLRFARNTKKLRKLEIDAKDQYDFVIKWDEAVNKTKGHQALERKRESHMAQRISNITKNVAKHSLFAVVEYQRLDGVHGLLLEKKNNI